MHIQTDFTSVTEVTGNNVTQAQLDRLLTRYKFALDNFSSGKILEVACGSGLGLGYLANKAEQVIGIDIDEKLVGIAKSNYSKRDNIEISTGDAHRLAFEDNYFAQVILYECIYYFPDPVKVLDEINRVLIPGGNLIYCSVNPEWEDFNPSPFSNKYFSAKEIFEILKRRFHNIEIYGSSPASDNTIKGKLISLIKKLAVKFHLIPGSMKGKELLKRLFFGKLSPLTGEIKDYHGKPLPIEKIDPNETIKDYIVIFATAKKR